MRTIMFLALLVTCSACSSYSTVEAPIEDAGLVDSGEQGAGGAGGSSSCDPVSYPMSCGSDSDCVASSECELSRCNHDTKLCVIELGLGDGAACNGDGHCVDHECCH